MATAKLIYPTNRAIATGLGVHESTVGMWRKEGMPNTSIAAAREWMEAHRPNVGLRETVAVEELKLPLVVLPENEEPEQVVKRLRLAERTIAGHIDAWLNRGLPDAMAERDKAKGKALIEVERKISIIHHKIEQLRREQRMAVSALLNAEADVVKLERARGKLITIDEAKDLVSKSILPICIAIRKIPESATSDEERKRFAAIAEALLAVLRDAATAAVQDAA